MYNMSSYVCTYLEPYLLAKSQDHICLFKLSSVFSLTIPPKMRKLAREIFVETS